jgi:hypothetical protein
MAIGTKSGAIIAVSEAARTIFFNLFAIMGQFHVLPTASARKSNTIFGKHDA